MQDGRLPVVAPNYDGRTGLVLSICGRNGKPLDKKIAKLALDVFMNSECLEEEKFIN